MGVRNKISACEGQTIKMAKQVGSHSKELLLPPAELKRKRSSAAEAADFPFPLEEKSIFSEETLLVSGPEKGSQNLANNIWYVHTTYLQNLENVNSLTGHTVFQIHHSVP